METRELYRQLRDAYSEKNLHEISSSIISFYREGDEGVIRHLFNLQNDNPALRGEKLSRIFSRLIMAYHPDRFEQIQRDLKALNDRGDREGLEKYAHILDMVKMEFDAVSDAISMADFEAENLWDYEAEGYRYIDDEVHEPDEFDVVGDAIMNHGFMAAVKRKIYGYLDVEFPVHLLEDLEVIEMAGYEIENLDGIECCAYVRILDLSDNTLTDISALGTLARIEEVYLQNNHIEYIEALVDLPLLRVADLSHNDIHDISPLFDCQQLEFINLIGNRVPDWQIEQLSLDGVAVVV
jgi:hypothetical protein